MRPGREVGGNVGMSRSDELARIDPLLHCPRRLEVEAQRAYQLRGETPALGNAATQLSQVHRLDRAEILHPIEMVKPQGDEGQQQHDEPLQPHPP